MNTAEIIEALRGRVTIQSGRHLYGVLGSYQSLGEFGVELNKANVPDSTEKFPLPLNVNRGILEAIPDEEFKRLASDEARHPQPTANQVGRAFEAFLRRVLTGKGLVVLSNFEMLFAYNLELNLLRSMATDDNRILLLLPGKKSAGKIIMFPDMEGADYVLPVNLIAENHMWNLDAK
jgi:hypothetical protein